MSETIHAKSGDVEVTAELDFTTHTWTSATTLPEGEFPFVVHSAEHRLELYSDGTFADVEGGAD